MKLHVWNGSKNVSINIGTHSDSVHCVHMCMVRIRVNNCLLISTITIQCVIDAVNIFDILTAHNHERMLGSVKVYLATFQ